MKYKLYALIVLYNKFCLESKTYITLNDRKDINLIVCDNSTQVLHNKQQVTQDDNIYISMHGNKGLSKAYNKALEIISKKDAYLFIFDDDTNIDESYFYIAKRYIESQKNDVYLPIVKTKSSILSPCVVKHNRCREAKTINELKTAQISAINSGMIINCSIFEEYRYDEELFLDCIDHDFMRTMNKMEKRIKIMFDNVIIQNYSMEEGTISSTYNRLCIMNHDLKIFYKNDKIMYLYSIWAYKISMIIRFKSFKFFILRDPKL